MNSVRPSYEDMKGNSEIKKRASIPRSRRFLLESMRHLVYYFIHGLIIIIPLAITIWIIYWIFDCIDGLLAPVLEAGFGRPMPGLGFAIIFISILLIGYFGIKFGRRRFFYLIERNVLKIPVFGAIYGGSKQILDSFYSSSGSKFLEVVFMEFPRKGIYTVGFVTSESGNKDGKKVLNVFIPTAPNPTSGFLQIVAEEEVVKTSMSVNDAMKMIVSAGKVPSKDIADILKQVAEPDDQDNVSQP